MADIRRVPWQASPSKADPNPPREIHTYVRIPATRTWLLVSRDAAKAIGPGRK